MTRAKRLCGIAAACLTLTAGVAVAGNPAVGADVSASQISASGPAETAPQPITRPGRPRPDADGDGRVSRAEFIDARLRPLVAMDRDNDGTVSAGERLTWRQDRMAEQATRRFERLDADSNGSVSRAEFDAAHQKAASRRGERRALRHSDPSASRDPVPAQTRDGGAQGMRGMQGMRAHRGRWGYGPMQARSGPGRDRISATAQPAPLLISEARTRAEALFSRLDQDADGFISRSERQSMMGQAGQRSGMGREGRPMRRPGRMQADPAQASPAAPTSE
jgi:Ca2+-binding EF-hand superfamily protein